MLFHMDAYSPILKMLIFQNKKNDFMYIPQCLKNSHNFTCGQYFFMKLAPLCSADTELLNHAKNSIFMKNPEWSLFSYSS